MKTNPSSHKGFTVLEFLIVVAIMTILIGLILVGLTSARKNARDQARVSSVQNIVVGLTQFHDICRVYPVVLDGTTPYPCLDGKTFANFVSDIDDYKINTGGEYFYASLADNSDLDTCIGFHIKVNLEGSDSSYQGSKSAASQSGSICNGSAYDFDGTATNVFDIKK
jgi:prepilin-type N-terminal cleavage/methylation domain-containing protein